MFAHLASDQSSKGNEKKGLNWNHHIKPEHRFLNRAAFMTLNDVDPARFYSLNLKLGNVRAKETMFEFYQQEILICPLKTQVYLHYLNDCLAGME